ncbi:MAG: LamG-like jellyroll fold domain-containing protein, partial [Clostridia bacterium]
KDGELAILTSTMGNDGYAFAGAKWIMRGLVPGDFVYLYGNEDDGVKLSFIPNDTLSIYTPVLYPTGYVKTNLVAQYDADHNTKDGLDRHAKAWYDLTGNGNDIAALPATNDCYFKDGYYTITKEEVLFPKTIVDTVNSGDFTVELVLGDVDFIGPSFGPLLNCANDNFSLFWRSGSGILELKTAGTSNARPKVPNAASLAPNSTITVTFKLGDKVSLYVNGVLVDSQPALKNLACDNFFFGHKADGKTSNTEYEEIRFYKKALSENEVAQNYAEDIKNLPVQTLDAKPTTTNIALGKVYTADVKGGEFRTGGYGDTKEDGTSKQLLTNGKFNDIAGYSTTQLEVVLDLGEKVNDITGLNIGFHYNFWGITSPAMVEYLISDDGKDFTSIKKLLFEDAKVSTPASDPISETAKISEFIYTPQVALSGRYIKVVIFVEGQAHVWGNELEVF